MNSLPPGLLVFDASAYIRNIRLGAYAWLGTDERLFLRTVLTTVVASELYAGARSAEDKADLDILCKRHLAMATLSSPNQDSWISAGILLGRYARTHGALRFADHFRDVLIALEAVKNAATLVTENARDFARWRKLLRSAGQHLRVFNLATW